MRPYFLTKKFLAKNLGVWGGIYLLFMTAQFFGSHGDARYFDTSITLLAAFILFYGNFFLCQALFIRRKALYFLSLAGILALYLTIIYLTFKATMGGPYAVTILIYFSLYFAVLILLSGFFWSTLFAAQKIKENARMQLELQQMENEKMFAEKKFLQSQVNPHFLYNTLNFLYAKSLNGNPDLSDGIMTLSAIMKYSLQKNENSTGFVLLADEVTHLQNVIHIHQLRFSRKLQISFSSAGATGQVELVPFVLITLVENALKHGEWSDPGSPIRINLLCDEARQIVFFSVVNKKRKGPKETGTGIGLDNILRRLKWSYQDNYSLQISDGEELFKAELTVPLYRSHPPVKSAIPHTNPSTQPT